jgi:hypothetical protein
MCVSLLYLFSCAHRGNGPWRNPEIRVYIEFSAGFTRVVNDSQTKATGVNKQKTENK